MPVEDFKAASFASTEFVASERLIRLDESLSLHNLSVDQIGDVVKLHLKCFPEYLLSGLGKTFLNRYCGEFLFARAMLRGHSTRHPIGSIGRVGSRYLAVIAVLQGIGGSPTARRRAASTPD